LQPLRIGTDMNDAVSKPPRDWNALIRDVVAGQWVDPATGKPAILPFETIMLAETLDGGEADVLAPLKLGKRLAVVSDTNTHAAMGARVAKSLKALGTIDDIVVPADLECSRETIAMISERTRYADAVVAVGSGVLSDSCKFATFEDGRKFAVFATAASMNGYAASTASVTEPSGYKISLPAHAPRGIFIDLAVNAAAPAWLAAAGFGDCLCRPTAQIDWWASHRLFGSYFSATPYALTDAEEAAMMPLAAGIATGSLESVGVLHRLMTLCGFGVSFTGVSNHGSMGEHQVSHWIDMFAGDAHPGTIHGQQVGVASLAIHRLQHEILALPSPPEVRPTVVDEAGILRRYGPEIGAMALDVMRKKALDHAGAKAFNTKLASLWPELKGELQAYAMPPATMHQALSAAGGPTTATTLGLAKPIWRDAMKYGREIRNRWSFLDLADDSGLLDDFLDRDVQ
jgi:glycerol-1-phosphate dehydrogenase [NAD(P)+]